MNRCIDCRIHLAIPDGNRCRGCVEAFLRETRPESLRVSPWVQRAREHRLPAKAIAA